MLKGYTTFKIIKPVMSHLSYVHCWVETLSMSKRIMDKVFPRAGDCDVNIYYQDTGSIYI